MLDTRFIQNPASNIEYLCLEFVICLMLCIVSPSTDPFFNLAAEEYLFKNFDEDIFFLYINTPSVVVGKHQNAMAEINPVFVYENDIKVIRRMSGGGAVYHDTGNLNFSFHKTVDDVSKVSYKDFNLPVVNALQYLGIPAEISHRNDIMVGDFKVSGHAQHVFRNRVMSHGTLLIESNIKKLSDSLKKGTGIYESKAIQSVRGKVANLSGFLSNPFSAGGFRDLLNHNILNTVTGAKEYRLNDSEIIAINELANQKYSSWVWNFGYSPAYRFNNKMFFSSGESLSCSLNVEKGLITGVRLEGDALTQTEKRKIEKGMKNQPHYPEFLLNLIDSYTFQRFSSEQFLKLFF